MVTQRLLKSSSSAPSLPSGARSRSSRPFTGRGKTLARARVSVKSAAQGGAKTGAQKSASPRLAVKKGTVAKPRVKKTATQKFAPPKPATRVRKTPVVRAKTAIKPGVKKSATARPSVKKAEIKKIVVKKGAAPKPPVPRTIAQKPAASVQSAVAPVLKKKTARRLAPLREQQAVRSSVRGLPEEGLARVLAVLDEHQAEDVVSVDWRGVSPLADYVVVAIGKTSRHVLALAQHCTEALGKLGFRRIRLEGQGLGDWALVDAGDIIVHILRPEVEAYYNLHALYGAGSSETPAILRPTDV